MTIPAYAGLVYEITSEVDDHLNDLAKTGRTITKQDIKDCIAAWVKQFEPNADK